VQTMKNCDARLVYSQGASLLSCRCRPSKKSMTALLKKWCLTFLIIKITASNRYHPGRSLLSVK
jgi:hypothetical protein